MNSIISIYIPRMSLSVNEQFIKEEFEKTLGEVSRIDFTCIDKKPGFKENQTHSIYKSAFIHFKNMYNNSYTNEILTTLNSEKVYKYYPQYKKEYWILLKAKNPIAETWMNNAQIVENCRYLENKLEIQEETIMYLKENLEKVLLKVNDLEKKYIYGDDEIHDTLLLHRKQDIMTKKKNSTNFSISSDSSIPGYINCDDYNSVSSSSTLRELNEYNNSPISEIRIRNSIDLCGNE